MHSRLRTLGMALVAAGLSACTVMRLDAEEGPARVESNGLIDGHVALGMRAEDDLFRLRLFEGDSDGSIAELSLWKLFRLEIGLLGLGVGVGPVDAALGIGFYEPELPEFQGQEPEPAAEDGPHPDCPACAKGL
jgi:hypothetical protein